MEHLRTGCSNFWSRRKRMPGPDENPQRSRFFPLPFREICVRRTTGFLQTSLNNGTGRAFLLQPISSGHLGKPPNLSLGERQRKLFRRRVLQLLPFLRTDAGLPLFKSGCLARDGWYWQLFPLSKSAKTALPLFSPFSATDALFPT